MVRLGLVVLLVLLSGLRAKARPFDFERDTFEFANATVYEYKHGQAYYRQMATVDRRKLYTQRCFVLSRSAIQFQKFARFEPKAPPVSDEELARRVRAVTREAAWKKPAPPGERIVFPGYANLRQLSRARPAVFKQNLGQGWPTLIRPGNYRMFYQQGSSYQLLMHRELEAAMARGELFAAYLSTFPELTINHAILVYGQRDGAGSSRQRYFVYDPNHPDAPRVLTWSKETGSFSYEKDTDFVGGHVRVYRIYSKPFQ